MALESLTKLLLLPNLMHTEHVLCGSNLSTLLLHLFSASVPHPKVGAFLIAVCVSPERLWTGDKAVSSGLVMWLEISLSPAIRLLGVSAREN